jgi:DNA-binding NtrC family response regulator
MEALIQEMLDGRILLAEAVGEFEKIYIEKAFEQNDRHLINTASALGIHRNTLSSKLSSYKEADQHRRPRKAATLKKRPPKKPKAKAVGGSR